MSRAIVCLMLLCCAGQAAEFNVPSVYDQGAGSISAVIGEESEVKLTSNGQTLVLEEGVIIRNVLAFRLEAPRASVQAARADVSLVGRTITITPKLP